MHSSFNHVFFTRSLNLIYHKHATSASGITILRFLRWCLSAQHFTAFSILKVLPLVSLQANKRHHVLLWWIWMLFLRQIFQFTICLEFSQLQQTHVVWKMLPGIQDSRGKKGAYSTIQCPQSVWIVHSESGLLVWTPAWRPLGFRTSFLFDLWHQIQFKHTAWPAWCCHAQSLYHLWGIFYQSK